MAQCGIPKPVNNSKCASDTALCFSIALRRGMNPVQLAQLLRHNGLRMIEQIYAHLNADDGYDTVLRMLTGDRYEDTAPCP